MTGVGLMVAMAMLAAAEPSAAKPVEAAKPAEAAAPAKPAAAKKVCVEEAQLGSLFKKRICATPEEWEKRRLHDQEMMSKQGGRASSCTGEGC